MELWGKNYFDMVGQAYIRICEDSHGEIRFGLVSTGLRDKLRVIQRRGSSLLFRRE